MRKLWLKLTVCAVALVVLFGAVTAFARIGHSEDEICVCNHRNASVYYDGGPVRLTKTFFVDSSQHVVKVATAYICNDCGKVFTRWDDPSCIVSATYEPHSTHAKGTCDGTRTTIRHTCRGCNSVISVNSYSCIGPNCPYPHNTINGGYTAAIYARDCHEHASFNHSHGGSR